MSDLSGSNEDNKINNNDNNSPPQMDNIISEANQLQGIDVVFNNNNDLLNLDQNPEIQEKKPITKDHNKSTEDEP